MARRVAAASVETTTQRLPEVTMMTTTNLTPRLPAAHPPRNAPARPLLLGAAASSLGLTLLAGWLVSHPADNPLQDPEAALARIVLSPAAATWALVGLRRGRTGDGNPRHAASGEPRAAGPADRSRRRASARPRRRLAVDVHPRPGRLPAGHGPPGRAGLADHPGDPALPAAAGTGADRRDRPRRCRDRHRDHHATAHRQPGIGDRPGLRRERRGAAAGAGPGRRDHRLAARARPGGRSHSVRRPPLVPGSFGTGAR